MFFIKLITTMSLIFYTADKLCKPLILRCNKKFNIFYQMDLKCPYNENSAQIFLIFNGNIQQIRSAIHVNSKINNNYVNSIYRNVTISNCTDIFLPETYNTNPSDEYYDLFLSPLYTKILFNVIIYKHKRDIKRAICIHLQKKIYSKLFYELFHCN